MHDVEALTPDEMTMLPPPSLLLPVPVDSTIDPLLVFPAPDGTSMMPPLLADEAPLLRLNAPA